MKTRWILAAFAFITLALPAQAQIDIAVWGSMLETQGDNVFEDPLDPDFDAELSFDSNIGFGASANIFWTERVSTEIAAYAVDADTTLSFPGGPDFDLGPLELTPITGTLQFHFAPRSTISPYLGVGVAHVLSNEFSSDDLDLLEIGEIDVDDETTWLANAGLSFSITPSFGIILDAKYFPFEPATRAAGDTEDLDIEINPLLLSAGLRLRF